MFINIPDHVENEDRYRAAAEARIRANAAKGKRARWFAADATRGALIDSLFLAIDSSARPSEFLIKMYQSYEDWGTLTEKQEAAVRNVFAKQAERQVARQAERAATAATSQHIGTVGERRDFTLTVTFATSFETQFGELHVLGLKDADGNVVIYKGSAPFADKGETVTVKATIKDHGERDGVKQTIIARPKVA